MALSDRLTPLLHHPQVEKLQRRYDQLPQRDQRALQGLSIALAVALVYLLVWLPVSDYRSNAQQSAVAAQQLLGYVQSEEVRARDIAAAGQSQRGRQLEPGSDFLTTVTDSAQQAGLPLARFEPSGNDGMRIRLEQVPFNELSQWLDHLGSQYGIKVDQASIERTNEPGRVGARITLSL
ncbi:MAG: type II secretion system protein M [Halomonadaceae bacterium]|nr:MAG: type II secretion system protein M [Halomonadaceae bacterium]